MMRNLAGRHFWPSLFLSVAALATHANEGSAPNEVAGVTDLRAALEDQVRPYDKKGIKYLDWHTYWVVHWRPVPGAKEYQITYFTSEGVSKKTKVLAQPPFRLESALGNNAKGHGLLQRELQLQTIQSMLSISIAPRMADGRLGPASPLLRVGQIYPESISK